jgi:uncharacterized protein YPO0396
MLKLKTVFLHNWHRLEHHQLDTAGSLFLTGHNGSGKSTIIDAMQFVLVGDLQRIRFNSSAQEKSTRNLDSYVRGKIGEDRFLRPGDTVGYVGLTFVPEGESARPVHLGVCIEASSRRPPERAYFIIKGDFEWEQVCSDVRVLTRKELKKHLRGAGGSESGCDGEVFESSREYQTHMLRALGRLPERFIDVFVRALTFQPIRDIRLFVEQWLLDPSDLQIIDLNTVTQRLGDLRSHADLIERKIRELEHIASLRAQASMVARQARDQSALAVVALDAMRWASVQQAKSALEQTEHLLQQAEEAAFRFRDTVQREERQLIDLRVALSNNDAARSLQNLRQQSAAFEAERVQIQELESNLRATLEKVVQELNMSRSSALAEIASKVSSSMPLTTRPHRKWKVELEDLLAQVAEALNEARLTESRLQDALKDQMAIVRKIETQLRDLDTERKLQFPAHVLKAKEELSRRLCQPVSFLCENLEITDESWQDAIEAVLGNRRYSMVLSDTSAYRQAQDVLRDLRKEMGLSDVSVLHLDRIMSEARRAQPGSLANFVTAKTRSIQSYVGHVLGGTNALDTAEQLENHQRAITRDCLLYSEWSTRALDLNRVRPWRCGARALASQRSDLVEQLRLAEAEGRRRLEQYQAIEQGQSRQDLSRILQTLNALMTRLGDRRLLAEVDSDCARLTAEIEDFDISSFTQLADAVASAEQSVRKATESRDHFSRNAAQLSAQRDMLRIELAKRERERAESLEAVAGLQRDDFSLFERAQGALTERLAESSAAADDTTVIEALHRNAITTAKGMETKLANTKERVIAASLAYNVAHEFAASPGDLEDRRYDDELARLTATELPRFRDEIAEQARKAEEELREHILHNLRERILAAKASLERLNRGLRDLTFRGESYRFRWYPSAEIREFYDLVMGSQSIGSGALQDSSFYLEKRASFERFYEILTMTPQNEGEREWRDSLLDYRTYLSYDIEVTHGSGQVSRLSRIMGQTSGGETQTPFYIAIAASFLQVYLERERSGHEAPRLVVFDEAFSKMDQERIAATIEVFNSFGLQVVTATPLERCEYLAPQMQTTLVLTGIGDSVHIEPYENYRKLLGVEMFAAMHNLDLDVEQGALQHP